MWQIQCNTETQMPLLYGRSHIKYNAKCTYTCTHTQVHIYYTIHILRIYVHRVLHIEPCVLALLEDCKNMQEAQDHSHGQLLLQTNSYTAS